MSISDVWYEFGLAGLSKEEGRAILNQLRTEANEQHCMGARASYLLDTGRTVVYDGGIDGWDATYYVQEA